jgi:hypothetical protein
MRSSSARSSWCIRISAAVYPGRTKQEGSLKGNSMGLGGVILDNHFLFPVHISDMNRWPGRVSEQIDVLDEAITKRRALDKSVFAGGRRYDSRAERFKEYTQTGSCRQRQGACADEP